MEVANILSDLYDVALNQFFTTKQLFHNGRYLDIANIELNNCSPDSEFSGFIDLLDPLTKEKSTFHIGYGQYHFVEGKNVPTFNPELLLRNKPFELSHHQAKDLNLDNRRFYILLNVKLVNDTLDVLLPNSVEDEYPLGNRLSSDFDWFELLQVRDDSIDIWHYASRRVIRHWKCQKNKNFVLKEFFNDRNSVAFGTVFKLCQKLDKVLNSPLEQFFQISQAPKYHCPLSPKKIRL
jgi:hypothetical protein